MATKPWLRRLAFPLYIVAAAAFLCLQALQGLSFLDIGMYLAGYRHFNSDPWSCYYLGQWFLTYKLTGALCSLLGINTFFGIRLLAVALNVATQTAIYLYLRRFVPRRHIMAGLALATLACFGSYTDINYNDWSASLLAVAIMAYHAGAFARRVPWLVAVSGAVVGVAFFFRAVNLSFVALPLLAVAVSRCCGARLGRRRQMALFASGCAAGCAAVLLLAWADGSIGIIAQTAADLAAIGGSADDPHSLKAVAVSLYTVWRGYLSGFAPAAAMAALMVVAGLRLGGARRVLALAALAFALVLSIYMWEPPGNVTAGVAVAALAFVVARGQVRGKAVSLFVLSLLVPIVFPAGSNGGTAFFGQYVGFLSTPLALSVLVSLKPAAGLRATRAYGAALRAAYAALCAALLLANARRPLMEDGTRAECRHAIGCEATGPILITEANAALYRYLLREAKPLIPCGSYMVCNFSTPMISVMDCKPYAVFSDVFTSDAMNTRYIRIAHARAGGGGRLPVMLLDRKSMTPGFAHVEAELRSLGTYRTAWVDGCYELLVPW